MTEGIRRSALFEPKKRDTPQSINAPLTETGAVRADEVARALNSWERFRPVDRGGTLIDICVPTEEGGTIVPTAIKVINVFSPQFSSIRGRIGAWASPEELEYASSYIHIPEGTGAIPSDQMQSAGLLALEHSMYERMYSPYVLPAVFVGFTPKVDVVDERPHTISQAETDARRQAGAITEDGKRYIMRKGVPALAMIEDYFEDLSGIDGAEPLQSPVREQLRELITKLEQGYRMGFYPDRAIAEPNRMNMVVVNGTQLILIDTNFLISTKSSFAKKDFEHILDALYYFAR